MNEREMTWAVARGILTAVAIIVAIGAIVAIGILAMAPT